MRSRAHMGLAVLAAALGYFVDAALSLRQLDETYGKDLDFVE